MTAGNSWIAMIAETKAKKTLRSGSVPTEAPPASGMMAVPVATTTMINVLSNLGFMAASLF
jgi:hypothetical protein